MPTGSAPSAQLSALQGSFLCLLSAFLARHTEAWWVSLLGILGVLSLALPLFRVPYWRRRWYAGWQLVLSSPSLLAAHWWHQHHHPLLAATTVLILLGLLLMVLCSLHLDRPHR